MNANTQMNSPIQESAESAKTAVTVPQQSMNPTPSKPKTTPVSVAGMKLTSKSDVTVNFRAGKANVVTCQEIECLDVNATGRRLTLSFRKDGKEILNRRVYLEWFESMVKQFAEARSVKKTPAKDTAPKKA